MRNYSSLACFVFALFVLAACGGGNNNVGGTTPGVPGADNRPVHFLSVPQVSLTPASLSFAAYVGSYSAPGYATLSNTGSATLSISSIAATCSLGYCFYQSNNCGTSLLAGAKCTITVRFRSGSVGTFSGTLAVHDNAGGSPQTVLLSGRATCVGVNGQCYSGHPCCPGLRCIPASTRAFCEPAAQTAQTYLPRSGFTSFAIANVLSVVDARKNELIRRIAVGPDANAVAITPDGKKVYVTDARADAVSVIDTHRNVVAKTIAAGFGDRPVDIAVSADGRFAYVSNASRNDVSVINTANDTVVRTIQSAGIPDSIAILRRCSPGIVSSPDGSIAFVLTDRYGPVPALQLAANMVLDVVLAGPSRD